eukprot:CAMPEP_0168316094 /NCGR_PEP_ID=MMETSP0210-20121227/14245_1 /TAXON_ID=40633 /ORGANISM="Condylostoma magnum, Strain COL2" /LENGTH=48 /DNA_ID= /DNA_START= /DNA_END= /DNA_ORIENTATION=
MYFLPLYAPNIKKGSYKHKDYEFLIDPYNSMVNLTDISYASGSMTYPE